jgi:hypothetical protein
MNKISVLFLCCFLMFCCNKGEHLEKNQEKTSEYSKQSQDQEKTLKNLKQNKREGKILKHSKQNGNEEDNYNAILGTKWIAPIISTTGRVFFDSLIFKCDCTLVDYSCEFEGKSFGKFYLKGDTVVVKSNVTYYPDNKTYKHVFKLLLFDDTLMPVYAKFGHQDPKIEFDSTYIFYKDTNTVLEEGKEDNGR